MELNIFGLKLHLELLILIGVIYLILVCNTVGSCSNMPLIFETMKNMNHGRKMRVH
jgi:hypothetical protein